MVYPSDSTLTVAQQKTAAGALGQAFSQDPFMAYLLPNATARVKQLTKLFLPMLRCSLRYGGVEVPPGGGGALAWLSGSDYPLRFSQIVRSGMIWTPSFIGISAFNRLRAHEIDCGQALKENATENFAYIWLVGVQPDQAGRGLGKPMIQSALDNMRRRGYSACFLRTENPKNVGMYEHLGFKTVHYGTPRGSQLPSWLFSQALKEMTKTIS